MVGTIFTQASPAADYQIVKTEEEMKEYLSVNVLNTFRNLLRIIVFPDGAQLRWRTRISARFAALNEKVDAQGNKFPERLYKGFFKKMCPSKNAMEKAIKEIRIEGIPQVSASEAYKKFKLLQEALLPIFTDRDKATCLGGTFKKVLSAVLTDEKFPRKGVTYREIVNSKQGY